MRPELGYEEQVYFYCKRGLGQKDALILWATAIVVAV